jgi:sugar transferase (PEP-CTERM/EpsH1 system associated)
MPIRIMHVVDHLGKGGLENGVANLIENLDATRFEHVVYAIRQLGPNADRLGNSGVRVIWQGKQSTDSRIQAPALVRAIREVKPDIVHSRNWAAVEAVLAGRWTRSCAVVHSEHGIEGDARAKEPWRRICFRRLAFELAHRVLSVSYQLRDLHARRTGFPAKRISVIHNGVDGRRFFPDPMARARVRQELNITEDEFCIGCVGNLLPVKAHMVLLQAIEHLAGTCKDWRLILLGEGPERPRLEAFIESHPDWKGRVHLPGTSDRVPELLNAMDVYVLPSLSEGISNSLLEAMSTGLPVIATDAGGNPEVVIDGESGWLFPVGDAGRLAGRLALLRTQRDLRTQLGHEARRRVQAGFSIEAMTGNYERLYESVGRADAPVRVSCAAQM